MLIGGETENLSWTQKPPIHLVIETFQLITLADCLICRRTINIPEIILGVHGLMGFTVTLEATVLKVIRIFLFQPVDNDNLVIPKYHRYSHYLQINIFG